MVRIKLFLIALFCFVFGEKLVAAKNFGEKPIFKKTVKFDAMCGEEISEEEAKKKKWHLRVCCKTTLWPEVRYKRLQVANDVWGLLTQACDNVTEVNPDFVLIKFRADLDVVGEKRSTDQELDDVIDSEIRERKRANIAVVNKELDEYKTMLTTNKRNLEKIRVAKTEEENKEGSGQRIKQLEKVILEIEEVVRRLEEKIAIISKPDGLSLEQFEFLEQEQKLDSEWKQKHEEDLENDEVSESAESVRPVVEKVEDEQSVAGGIGGKGVVVGQPIRVGVVRESALISKPDGLSLEQFEFLEQEQKLDSEWKQKHEEDLENDEVSESAESVRPVVEKVEDEQSVAQGGIGGGKGVVKQPIRLSGRNIILDKVEGGGEFSESSVSAQLGGGEGSASRALIPATTAAVALTAAALLPQGRSSTPTSPIPTSPIPTSPRPTPELARQLEQARRPVAAIPSGQSSRVSAPIAVPDLSWLQTMNTSKNCAAFMIALLSSGVLAHGRWYSKDIEIGVEASVSGDEQRNRDNGKKRKFVSGPLTAVNLLNISSDVVVENKEKVLGGICISALGYLAKNGIQAYFGHGKE